MLADPFVLKVNVESGPGINRSFTLLNVAGNSTTRSCAAVPVGGPRVLKISHSQVGKGSTLRNRHLARLEAYALDENGDERKDRPISAHVVLDIPVEATAAQITDLWKYFVGLLRGGSSEVAYDGDQTYFWDRLILGES